MADPRRGKIKKAPAPEVVKYLIRPAIAQDLQRSYDTMLDINRAHVVMLAKQGIITREVAGKILAATDQIASEKDAPTFEINPDVEDLYFNLERYLIKLTGKEVGGQQHTARSRNDLFATEVRIDTRRYYLKLCRMFNEMRRTYLEVARNNLDAVMSGYTHMQPSEPITFAHYCSAVLSGLGRDYARLSRSWEFLNQNPLGGGSMGSTSFPIDRNETTRLLGFDAPVQNSLDCTGSRDFALEIAMALACTATTMSRSALDLYNWSTPDYGWIEVDDSCAACSSIMPQKKNAFTFEHIKGKAAHIGSFMTSIMNAQKNVFYSHCRDISVESVRYFWTAMQEMEASFALMTVTLRTMQLRKKRMYETACRNFCTVTELANYLVRHDGLAFREAHEIIAGVCGNLYDRGLTSADIDRAAVNEVALELYGKETRLTDELIKEALDPARVANEKTCLGGTSPAEVTRQLDLIEAAIAADEAQVEIRAKQLAGAAELLKAECQAMIAG